MAKVLGHGVGEYVEVARAEDEGVEHLRDEGDTWEACQLGAAAAGTLAPSALLLAWIAHIRMSLETVCETSPRTWKTLKLMAAAAQPAAELTPGAEAGTGRRVRWGAQRASAGAEPVCEGEVDVAVGARGTSKMSIVSGATGCRLLPSACWRR